MSYAAESYPYIAKQVLASLTGGAVREMHRFLAVLNASGFSTERPSDDVVSESITVAGLSSGTFKVFAPGEDYEESPDGKIRFFADEHVARPFVEVGSIVDAPSKQGAQESRSEEACSRFARRDSVICNAPQAVECNGVHLCH